MIWSFWLLEFSIYLPMAFFTFIGNYFNQLGFSDLQNGVLGSTAAIIILVSNPFWMRVSDKRIKNTILTFISFTTALSIWLIYLFKNFWAIFFISISIGFLWTSIIPIAESMASYNANKFGFSFGKARMMGSLGYALVMLLLGYMTDHLSFFLIGSLSFVFIGVSSLLVPKTQGYNVDQKTKFSLKNLPFQFYRMLIFEILVLSSNAFGLYFMPVLMRSRGYAVSFAGISIAVQALAEIPFFFFADRIIKKLGIKNMLVIGAVMFGVRWILTFLITNPIIVVALQSFEFFNWVAIYYAVFYYVNSKIAPSQRSDAHALFWMTTSGISMIFGDVFGGWISNTLGVANGYFFFGIFSLVIGLTYAVFEKSPDLS